jgi:hypothetical protein
MAIVIELISGNRVSKYCVADEFPFTIGRGYQCDMHIDDAYVEPEHLIVSIDEGNQIIIEDLNSQNGSKVNGKRVTSSPVKETDNVVIGKSELRLFSADKTLEPALQLSPVDDKLSLLGSVKIAATLCVIYCCFYMGHIYLTSFVEFKLSNHINSIAKVLLSLSIWPLFFALLSRLNKYQGRLSLQYSLIFIFALLSMFLSFIGRIIEFNFESSELWFWSQQLLTLALFGGLAWLTLLIAFHQPHKRRARIAISMTILLGISGYGLIKIKEDKFSFKPQYKVVLMPPSYQFNRFQDVNSFLDKTNDLFTKANQDKSAQ